MSAILRARASVPPVVRRLAVLSFWNDTASELAYPLIPLFLTRTLGAPVAVVGLIEGIAESLATGLRGPAGAWSDRHGRRPLIVAGYGIAAIAKPLIAIATAWPLVLVLRMADRTGKGIRTAPRDALISDATTPETRGAAFGYHRSLDTLGAVLGPLVAVGMLALGVPIRWVLAVAIVPGLVTLYALRALKEPPRTTVAAPVKLAWRERLSVFDRRLVLITLGVALFSLGNSSDAFLILRASDLGLSTALCVLAYAAYNVVSAAIAWPAGVLSDRIGRRALLSGGMLAFAAVYLGFAAMGSSWQVWPLFLAYGVAVALTDGIAKALVADAAPRAHVGAVLGVFTAVAGLCALIASLGAGILWDVAGPGTVFALGAAGALSGALVIAGAAR